MSRLVNAALAACRFFSPGQHAINDMHKYATKFGKSTDPRTKRRGLACKAFALIYSDRVAV